MGQRNVSVATGERAWHRECLSSLLAFAHEQCRPPDTSPMWRWWEANIILDNSGPFPGRYRTELTPMVRWLGDWVQNPRVRRITGMGAAQTIKTQFLLNLFQWRANERPGTTMWVMANADMVREFWSKRLEPAINGCEKTKARYVHRNRDLVSFDSMNLLLRGSESRSKLQSDPIQLLICDERREWRPGAIDLVRKRTRTFSDALEISMGTAGSLERDRNDPDLVTGDELAADYFAGSQTIPHFTCLDCGHSQPFRFGREKSALFAEPRDKGGMVWDKNETTCPNGKWNYSELAKTVRYECEHCGRRYEDDEKISLLATLHPVDHNPHAPPDKKSLHWAALSFLWPECHWAKLTEEFLRAIHARRGGNLEPLKAFVTETLGEPWEDRLGVVEDFGFLEARRGDYKFGEVWPEELMRFMAADRQEAGGEHYWWVIRAWARLGKSRLIAYGRASTKAELEQIRIQYQVPLANACIDAGWAASDVYRFCISTGWKPFKGEPTSEYFLHRVRTGPNTWKTVRRLWQASEVDAFMGKAGPAGRRMIKLYRHVGDATKDELLSFMTGLVGEWSIPRETPRVYYEQVTAESRVEKLDSKGRPERIWKRFRRDNHLGDCELIILIAAKISKVISAGNTESESGSEPSETKKDCAVPVINDGSDCDTGQAGQTPPPL